MTAGQLIATARPYRDDGDYWKVRDLLTRVARQAPVGWVWEVRRWDGQRWHNADPAPDPTWCERIRLWEARDGYLMGVVQPESQGEAHIQLHPDWRCLEPEMVAWAEEALSVPAEATGQRRLDFFVMEYDAYRRRLLEQRGYTRMPWTGAVRRLRLNTHTDPPPRPLAAGYALRTTRPELADGDRVAAILNAAFNRTFHQGCEVFGFTAHAPSFRRDLDLAAEAPDGSFAAYVGVCHDPANRRGIFEPVCTHPDHRRKGLAQALMLEGLRRLRALGAQDVLVDTGDAVPANALYESVGFAEAYLGTTWRKVW